jgi:hypothetical protein
LELLLQLIITAAAVVFAEKEQGIFRVWYLELQLLMANDSNLLIINFVLVQAIMALEIIQHRLLKEKDI